MIVLIPCLLDLPNELKERLALRIYGSLNMKAIKLKTILLHS